jgi:hypothetical protein
MFHPKINSFMHRFYGKTYAFFNHTSRTLLSYWLLRSSPPLCQRALEICENVLGPKHPNTVAIISNLEKRRIEILFLNSWHNH